MCKENLYATAQSILLFINIHDSNQHNINNKNEVKNVSNKWKC